MTTAYHMALPVRLSFEEEVVVRRLGVDRRQTVLLVRKAVNFITWSQLKKLFFNFVFDAPTK
jgi:hypothetical protein